MNAGFILDTYSEEQQEALYRRYAPQLEGKTDQEKEDTLVTLVSRGIITADQAIVLAVKSDLDLGA
jgi:hypothetical protein